MAIPRFNSQIQQIQVPSMKNYQEEQNASIAKSLADFGYALLGGAIQLGMQENKNKKTERNKTYWERYQQATGLKQASNNSINQPIDESGC